MLRRERLILTGLQDQIIGLNGMNDSLDKHGVVLYNLYNRPDKCKWKEKEAGTMSREAGFGRLFRQLRARTGLTLREFCEENGFDPGNLSRLERGILPPPQSPSKIEEYARALGLEKDSDEWIEFYDQAALSRGQIPRSILSDEEVLARLPLVFRTLRGQRVTQEQIGDLIELIRGN